LGSASGDVGGCVLKVAEH